jgi:hypothetical protein
MADLESRTMPNVMIAAVQARKPSAKLSPKIWQLLDAIRAEAQQVNNLIHWLRRQRAAVIADQLEAIEDTTFGIQRVLRTLAEAHRLRAALSIKLGLAESPSTENAFDLLGEDAARLLRQETARLKALAAILASDAADNRSLLRAELPELSLDEVPSLSLMYASC